ncbi:hypothetical protein ACFQVC_13035 [Streptomyces monticola]|uniref:Uncharacterized protein n=1 Tax=Streptomyces monticola TaxID=2666263 RepID=A0ABW2JH51_9ACTN
MFFGVIGAIFFVLGWLLVLNVKNFAGRAFNFYAKRTVAVGTATPGKLRVVGGFWIPVGAVLLIVAFVK